MENIEYIKPNEIGYMEIPKKERIIILKYEKKYTGRFLRTIALAAIVIFCLYMGLFFGNEINIECIGPVVIYTGFTITSIRLTTQVKYTAAAYGTVVHKDIIKQRVIAGVKYRYRRYFSEPPHTDKLTTEQEFYYLTLKLADGRYIRYVNCLRKDFISVSEGDTVLAVCYGFNEIKGYII